MGDGELRIGDRERREIDDRLRAAHDDGMLTLVEYDERAKAAYAARFRSELDPLIADLPAPVPQPAPDERPTTATEPAWHDDARPPEPEHHGRHRGRRGLLGLVVVAVVAIVAPGVVSADQGAAVFGSRTVQVAPGESTVQVGVLFGSTKVVVPDGTHVTTTGTTIFGSTNCDTACAPGPPGAPEVQVSGRGAFGSIQVLTATEGALRAREH
ncbi:DUF1707 domain-containing protein [Actinomycetospora endophytica]|uniref:DUF1707 domain-containing protein n=1 Tax=Actinomycetospora endophytica TaxID=2291215 RepID=A0ABS8P570_9PSEU|nr:DUF1707 domain-containing protein [Actinomycetospora endophytica]MCD2193403.1 DUF1707 domain-containing protein [Actinomycetospora endophytica]